MNCLSNFVYTGWLCLPFVVGAVHAQVDATVDTKYPTKPIRVIVAQVPGGTADTVMRMYAQKMGDSMGQRLIVDNRGGSGVGSMTALQLVSGANADGYTLMLAVPSLTFSPALVKDMSIDVEKDFAPISLMNRESYLVATTPSLPTHSIKEFIALAKAKPGAINAGAGNFGSGTHLITMQFLDAVGVREQTTYIPYNGVSLAFIDAIAGRVQMTLSSIVSVSPHVRTGKLRALASTGVRRAEHLPDTPTVAEQGFPGFEATAWNGILAPAKTPPARISLLATHAVRAAKLPEIRDKLKSMGSETVGSTPQEFQKMISVEVTRWRQLVKKLGIAPS